MIHEEAGIVQYVQREDDRAEQRVDVALLEAEHGHHQAPQHQHPQAREQRPPLIEAVLVQAAAAERGEWGRIRNEPMDTATPGVISGCSW